MSKPVLTSKHFEKVHSPVKNSVSYLPGAAKGSYGSIVGITSGG